MLCLHINNYMHHPLDWIDEQLDILQQQGLRRRLSTREGAQSINVMIEGQETINFGSNDYLNLASDPRLTAAVAAALQRSRLGKRGQSANYRSCRIAPPPGTTPGRVRGDRGGIGFHFGIRREHRHGGRFGGRGRRGVYRPQESRQPDRRLPAFAGRRPHLSACRLGRCSIDCFLRHQATMPCMRPPAIDRDRRRFQHGRRFGAA